MTTLSAHTSRAIHNKGMQAVYGIAAEYNVDAADVIALLGTTSHTSIAGHHSPFARIPDTTPSQPELTSLAPAADPSIAPTVDVKAEGEPHEPSTDPIPSETANEKPEASELTSSDPQRSVVATRKDAKSLASGPIRGRPDTTRAKVVACHLANPLWPSKLIAEHLGISEAGVRAAANRKKIVLVSWWEYQRAQAAATTEALRTAVEPLSAISAEPQPETPPPAILAPAIEPTEPPPPSNPEPLSALMLPDEVAIQPDETVQEMGKHWAMSGRPSNPTRFYLRDKAGRYVHGSLERSPTDNGPLMTTNRTYAWFDNAQRYRGALKKWPEIAALRKEGPAK